MPSSVVVPPSFPFLKDLEPLGTVRKFLKDHKIPLMVDTEFRRVSTYWPQLGLIQLGMGEHVYFIDPFQLEKSEEPQKSEKSIQEPLYEPLKALLEDPDIEKVLHACHQDMEIFMYRIGAHPRFLFDTQVAAQFCGFGNSVSYHTLVQHYAGEVLDKSAQLTPWLHRPLTPEQLLYAYHDVKFLTPVYQGLRRDLKAKGYEAWAQEEMKGLEEEKRYQSKVQSLGKGIQKQAYSPQVLAKIKALLRARETLAQGQDKPRGHILKDETLVTLALKSPQTLEDFAALRGVRSLGPCEKRLFLEALKNEKQEDQTHGGLSSCSPSKGYGLTPKEKDHLQKAKAALQDIASHTGICASLIATSQELETWVRDPESPSPLMQGWRYEVFGRGVLKTLI